MIPHFLWPLDTFPQVRTLSWEQHERLRAGAQLDVHLPGLWRTIKVEMTPAATVTASSGMATSTKKRSFMDRQDGATRVIWSSNEQLGITEPTPSKEPATKKPRTMPPTPDRVLVLPTDKLLLLSTD
ncbi:hypothetical protein LTR15_003947 [Elasticomyces elasticus]|nr:hypothetical protein LTR15_003947 [Elasticomyces elasticus]